MGSTRHRAPNRILACLSDADKALLRPHLIRVPLAVRKVLHKPGTAIKQIYFINSGIASVVAVSNKPARRLEVGLIGREGFTGIEAVLGNGHANHEVFVQVAGSAQSLPVGVLRAAMSESASLRHLLLRYANALMVQTAYTALANGRATIEARLARWLLMADDRLDAPTLPLTHELLALMLGVRRAGVTVALQVLEHDGLIHGTRGKIRIVDRDALADKAGGIYGRPEAAYQRLIGGAEN